MTDDLVQRLKGHSENMERDKGKFVRFIDVATCTEAAELIEAQTAEIERLLEALAGPMAWLDSWARHVGNCQGGYFCTCGLVAARSELSAARSELSAAIAAVKGA